MSLRFFLSIGCEFLVLTGRFVIVGKYWLSEVCATFNFGPGPLMNVTADHHAKVDDDFFSPFASTKSKSYIAGLYLSNINPKTLNQIQI